MKVEHVTVKVVNGVKAMQVLLNGVPVIKFCVLPNGFVRLLWVMGATGAQDLDRAIEAQVANLELVSA